MIRRAEIKDIPGIIELLHQVDMVHHVLRPDLFKPNTTKYDEQELKALIGDDSKPIFVFDDGAVLGHAFCLVTEVKDDKLLQDIKTLYIDDICVDEKARGKHVGKALYEYVRDYAQSIGCNNITLNVWDGNDAALSFYRNMGMKVQKTTMEIILWYKTKYIYLLPFPELPGIHSLHPVEKGRCHWFRPDDGTRCCNGVEVSDMGIPTSD